MKTNNLHTNKGGFTVPKDYFDNFEGDFFNKISREDKDSSLLPDTLSSGLQIPDDYFNKLEDRLITKLSSDATESSALPDILESGLMIPNKFLETVEKDILRKTIYADEEAKTIPLFTRRNFLYVSGIAAMIAVIVAISIQQGKNTYNFNSNFNTVDIADIQEYVDEGNAEFSDTEIATFLNDEVSLIDTFDEFNDISDEELESYLSEEKIENEIIYIE